MTTYSTGTVAIGASSVTLTGTGTNWLTSGIRAGDRLTLAGLSAYIAAVNSNTSITLSRPWPGGAQSGAGYDVQMIDDNARALTATNALLQQLGNGTLTSLAGLVSSANKAPYFTGANVLALADQTPAGRAIMALTGATGAKLPVVTALGAAALRDILGTVSMSGGVPGGALFEFGENANGMFFKLAGGLLVCINLAVGAVDINVADGSAFRSASLTWTYPHSFLTGSPPLCKAETGDIDAWGTTGSAGANTAALRGKSNTSKTGVTLRGLAIGRWA